MRALRPFVSLAVLLFCFCTSPVRAQDDAIPPPAHIAFVEGTASLDREDGTEPALPGAPLVDGDRLTTAGGRAEITFPDGSTLDVDEDSRVEIVSPAFLRLTAGRILLLVTGAADPANAPRFQIDTPAGSVHTLMPGEYRMSIVGGLPGSQTELAVLRGSAMLSGDRASMPLRAGERSMAWANRAPAPPQAFNSARFDAFDRWVALRRDERLSPRSTPYLPAELRGYGGMMDRAGTWSYDAPYGYVWYPNVAADWRPYSEGYWASLPDYGWMWVGATAWSWPTHHYGRWGHTGVRWYWIPGRTFAPAWVSWGGAPGYVSWCPLGFDNRPVFALSVGSRTAWSGWTVLSRDHFGVRGYRVGDYALRGARLPRNTPFLAQAPPPPSRGRDSATRRYPSGTGVWNRNDRPASGQDTGMPPPGAAPPNGERRWEPRPQGAVPRDQAAPRDRSTDPFTMRPGRGPTRGVGPAAPGRPPIATQPDAPARPRDGASDRRSPRDAATPGQPPASAGEPAAPRSRRPPGIGPRDERPPASYPVPSQGGREQRGTAAVQTPPEARGERPSPSGEGGRAQARRRDGEGGGRAVSAPSPDRSSGGGGRGSRRPR